MQASQEADAQDGHNLRRDPELEVTAKLHQDFVLKETTK